MGLVSIFWEKPLPKILDFFRLHAYWDYSIKDVSKATGLSYRTLQMAIPELTKKGFIQLTRTEGKAKMYQYNSESAVAKKLDGFAKDVYFEIAKMHSRKKIAVNA
ncbi:MAG: hypothetical protein HY365_03050 [Candidatus Aenigmarchaeota archaeon]|nr:hypothetical protein [Candidatus Aenigmarchaeota archaeon]